MRTTYTERVITVGKNISEIVSKIDRRKKQRVELEFETKISSFVSKRGKKFIIDNIMKDPKGRLFFTVKNKPPKWFTYEMVMNFKQAYLVKEIK